MKTAQEPAGSFVATLDRVQRSSLGDISPAEAAKIARRVASADQDSPPTLDVAAFGSSI